MKEILLNKVTHCDFRQGISVLDDESVDLVVTDPPYINGHRSNRRVKTNKFDIIANDDDFGMIATYIRECHRIMKNNTAIYMFCDWRRIDQFKREFEKYFKLKNILVWDKGRHGSGDLKGSYDPRHEFVLFGHKGRTLLRGKREPDIISGINAVGTNQLRHPNQKPVELIAKFIKNSSDEGDIVFDGFSGIGTTLKACRSTGRNFIGFEIDERWVDIANEEV